MSALAWVFLLAGQLRKDFSRSKLWIDKEEITLQDFAMIEVVFTTSDGCAMSIFSGRDWRGSDEVAAECSIGAD